MIIKKYIKFNEYSSLKSFFKKAGPFRLLVKKVYPDTIPYTDRGKNKAIFVTGIHRSGTSWIGDILSYGERLLYWREPYNPSTVSAMKKQFTYLPVESKDSFYRRFTNDLFKGDFVGALFDFTQKSEWFSIKCHRHLIKDPTAAFMLEWMENNYDLDVIIVGRHPAGFVSSILRLNWDFDFNIFLNQNDLMDKYLFHYKDVIREHNKPGMNIAKAAVLWCVVYYVLEQMSFNKPVLWIKYEDICENPIGEFKKLFKKINLEWNSKVENKLISSTKSISTFSDNITTELKRDTTKMKNIWKDRLTDEDQKTIHNVISQFDIRLYEHYRG